MPPLALYSLTFIYGTNLWADEIIRRCPDNIFTCIAKLDGWKWIINQTGVATIIPSPNDHVWGKVLLLHERDEHNLDYREGPNYVKSVLPVELKGVEKNPGAVLTHIDKNTTLGSPEPPYVESLKEAMKDGKAKGIPQEYFNRYWLPYINPPPVEGSEAEALRPEA